MSTTSNTLERLQKILEEHRKNAGHGDTILILGDGMTIGVDGSVLPKLGDVIDQIAADGFDVILLSHFAEPTLRQILPGLPDSVRIISINSSPIGEESNALCSVIKIEFARDEEKPFLDGSRLLLRKEHPNYRDKLVLLRNAVIRLNNQEGCDRWICAEHHYGLAIEPVEKIDMIRSFNAYIDGKACKASEADDSTARKAFYSRALIIYADGGNGFAMQQFRNYILDLKHIDKAPFFCVPSKSVARQVGHYINNNQLGQGRYNHPSVSNADELTGWLMGLSEIGGN